MELFVNVNLRAVCIFFNIKALEHPSKTKDKSSYSSLLRTPEKAMFPSNQGEQASGGAI